MSWINYNEEIMTYRMTDRSSTVQIEHVVHNESHDIVCIQLELK